MMRARTALLLAIALIAFAGAGTASAPVLPSSDWILDQVRTLSVAGMEGRAPGTPGGERAAAHVARMFREAGLQPGGDAGGYLQAFSLEGRGTAANVIGLVPGRHPGLRSEAVVIGAHYDHLGHGAWGSNALDQIGAVHHGADDNASGTAAVLALARAFAAAGGADRTLVFVAFSGEELGLLGSAHYTRQPAWPIENTALMVNLDMVGRLRNGLLYVGGVDSGTGLRELVARAALELPLSIQMRGHPGSASDHSSFYAAGRPVLFLFTGVHADYHRPSDTWDRINAAGLAAVTTLAARVVSAAAAAPTAPRYVKLEPPRRPGALFGIVADHENPELTGVRVAGVQPGSPADRCGVLPGDLIVRFAGVNVDTLDDLHAALRGRRPGDRVPVVFRRDGRPRSVEATLAARR
jgi:hypothetical protein